MLRNWGSHSKYQEKLYFNMLVQYEIQRSRVVNLNKSISKLYLLNLDNLLPVIKPLYPDFGRPAKNQQGLEPPTECKCSNSKFGKVIYIKPNYDARLFPPVPRGSEEFKRKFKTRTWIKHTRFNFINVIENQAA